MLRMSGMGSGVIGKFLLQVPQRQDAISCRYVTIGSRSGLYAPPAGLLYKYTNTVTFAPPTNWTRNVVNGLLYWTFNTYKFPCSADKLIMP